MKLRLQETACLLVALALPTVAVGDIVSTATLTAGSTINFDTGTVGTSGGDLLWNGSTLTPQGNATAYGFPGSQLGTANYTAANQTVLTLLAQSGVYTKNTLSGSAVAPQWIIAIHTNGGHYAKLLVDSNSGGTIKFEFTTYGATAGGGGGGGGGPTPTISAVENAATNIPPILPNGAIAQGALFVVKGANLGPASVAIATAFPLQTTIGGTSIQVTVAGTTVNAIMYYSLAAQIAAILPSKTPVGAGTLTVTYNGQTSATASINVVANNIGVFTLNTTGSGDAVATLPATNTVVSPTNAPNPGEVVTLWATGLGPVTFDETNPAQQADMSNVPLKVFIAGQPAAVLFRGRNACCSGVDTIYVTVPTGLSGCANSVVMQIGNLVSNATSIPIGTNGRNCVPINPTQTTGGTGTHSFGGFALERVVETIGAIGPSPASTTKEDLIGGSFEKITITGNTPPQGSQMDTNSYGSCTVSVTVSGQSPTPPTSTIQWLDAGQVTVSGPGIAGNRQIAKSTAGGILTYLTTLDNTATTFAAGTYTFTGAGGPDVGPFTANYNLPQPFVWTNQAALATINRAGGATVTWSGGDPAGYVGISGSSTAYGATAATSASAAFTCTARVSDGSFTIPSVVLLAVPASSAIPNSTIVVPGTIAVSTSSGAASFQASGIDAGGISSAFVYGGSALYQ